MNGTSYVKLLQEKLDLHMHIHECTVVFHDSAPCHQSNVVEDVFEQDQCDNTALAREQLRSKLKKKFFKNSSNKALREAIKEFWTL